MNGVGGLAGWRWIFILCVTYCPSPVPVRSTHQLKLIREGIATIVIGIVASFVLPQNLETAKFLSEEERAFAGQWFGASFV